jgi:hypothetical protein
VYLLVFHAYINEMHSSRTKIPSKNLVRQCCAKGFNSGVQTYWFDKQVTIFRLFLAALRNVNFFPTRIAPGHTQVAVRIHAMEFTTPIHAMEFTTPIHAMEFTTPIQYPTAKINAIPYSHVLLCYGCHQLWV